MLSSLPTHLSAELLSIPSAPAAIAAKSSSYAQDFTGALAKFHKVSSDPFLQSLQDSLDDGSVLKHINWCALFGVTCQVHKHVSNISSAH